MTMARKGGTLNRDGGFGEIRYGLFAWGSLKKGGI